MELVNFVLSKDLASLESINRAILTAAKLGGKIEILKLLIQRNGDINFRDQHGNTPLLSAAFQGDIELVYSLLF